MTARARTRDDHESSPASASSATASSGVPVAVPIVTIPRSRRHSRTSAGSGTPNGRSWARRAVPPPSRRRSDRGSRPTGALGRESSAPPPCSSPRSRRSAFPSRPPAPARRRPPRRRGAQVDVARSGPRPARSAAGHPLAGRARASSRSVDGEVVAAVAVTSPAPATMPPVLVRPVEEVERRPRGRREVDVGRAPPSRERRTRARVGRR